MGGGVRNWEMGRVEQDDLLQHLSGSMQLGSLVDVRGVNLGKGRVSPFWGGCGGLVTAC